MSTDQYETLIHKVNLDVVIRNYLADLKIQNQDLEEISKEFFIDQAKGLLIVHVNCKKKP